MSNTPPILKPLDIKPAYRRRSEEEKTQLAEEVIQYLNDMLWVDLHALRRLLEFRTPCNDAMSKHDTCQVGEVDGEDNVSALGLINGLIGARPDGWGYVTAVYNDHEHGRIERFQLTQRESDSAERESRPTLPAPEKKPWKPEHGDQIRVVGAHRLAGARGKVLATTGVVITVELFKGGVLLSNEQHQIGMSNLEPSESK